MQGHRCLQEYTCKEVVLSSLIAGKRTYVAHASYSLANHCLPCAIDYCCTSRR